jgi:Ca2+-binding EF-hand superfamily protein
MKKFTILAGTALLAAAGVALAQPTPGARFDRNADVTRQQVIERADQRFARLDVNNDGRATAEEARQAAETRRAERAGRAFERLDLNRDGSITRAEFDQARSQLREQRAERRAERGPRMAMRGHRRGGPGMRGMRAQRLFGEQGFVTREQMRERALARFDRLDANRDGTLTVAERQQARAQLRQRIQERREQRD